MKRLPGPMLSARRIAASARQVGAWRHGSSYQRILAATASTAVMIGLVKLAVLVRDLVLAWRFGTADEIDAFLIAFLLPSAIINIVVGAFASSMIPAYVRLRMQSGMLAARRLAGNALVMGGLLLVALMAMVALLGPILLPLLAGSFTAEKLRLAQSLMFGLVPLILFQGFAAMWSALINTAERFAIVAFVPVVTPVLTVILLLALGGIGIRILVLGLVLGGAIEALVLAWLAARQKLPVLPHWHGYDAETAYVVRQFGSVMGSAVLMSGSLFIDQAMAAMLAPGSVAALNYGSKLTGLVLGLAALPLGTAVLPYFAEQAARNATGEIRKNLRSLVLLIAGTAVPLTLLLALLSEPIVRIVFERGAFTAADTGLVAETQAMYVLQIPFYLAGILGVRLLSTLGLNSIVLRIAAVNFTLNIVLNLVFMQLMGLPGIALATSIVYVCSASMIYARLMPHLDRRGASGSALQ